MPPRKRKREALTEEVFDQIMEFLLSKRESIDWLRQLKSDILSRSHETNLQKRAATEFTLDEAVATFGLQHAKDLPLELHLWKIQDIPETKGFQPTPDLLLLLDNYSKNYDRSSKAACRVALHYILNECLTVIKDNHAESGGQATDGHSQRTHATFGDIKVFCQVSFSHKIPSVANTDSPNTIVNGHVDHVICRVPKFRPANNYKRRIQSLLLAVDATEGRNQATALSQLVVYLGSLHQSRLSQNRSDASVYGFSSDGYVFTFVTITHDGTLKQSEQFDVEAGDINTILGCLKYLLEISANMSPNATPEERQGHPSGVGVGDDPVMDLDDNEYMNDEDEDSEY